MSWLPTEAPLIKVQSLGENLSTTVEQAQGANPDTFEPIDTTPVESIPSVSNAPNSSFCIPSATLVPLAMVRKLEAHMAKLLYHIQPWMQRSIAEAEERIERKISQHT